MKIWKWLFGKRKVRNLRGKALGAVPSPKDPRDYSYVSLVGIEPETLPDEVRLEGWTIKNQGLFGSCSAHAVCTAAEILMNNEVPLSERFNWYLSRQLEGKLPKNTGVYLRDALKVAQTFGLAPESLCSYEKDTLNIVPNSFAYGFAKFFRIGAYAALYSNEEMRQSLANKHPVIIGMSVDDAFLNLQELVCPPYNASLSRGGHALCIFGYTKEGFLVINSWGALWGQRGTFLLPYAQAENSEVVFEKWAVTQLAKRGAA